MSRDPVRDVVRGLTSLEMTFVNISSLQWTAHSGYVGQVTYADTIFPCFAFLSGMSPAPIRRNVGLIGIGLSLQTVSAFANGKDLRIPGVLQRLGLASILASEPSLGLLQKYYGLPLVALWYTISLFGSTGSNPLAHPDYDSSDQLDTAQTKIDKFMFGQHIHTPTHDPEGLLGSLTTAVSMLIGQAFQLQTLSKSQKALESIGMIAVGEALHFMLPKYAPISKSLWTPSFVLVTSGTSILKYLAVEAMVPYLPEVVQSLLVDVGRRSLEVYIISTILTMMARFGGNESIYSRGKRTIEKMAGRAGADFFMSLSLTGLVAASAKVMVSQRMRLQW